ncbi:MAG TPA: NADH-quinone oxidoreductase subunit N [Candidatus Sulfomarinibacteraceae bacterium]|nr:NADH-quinone oxidoreductase subunit N [Candidatus Sulfomarinibacteraceae bacterium]
MEFQAPSIDLLPILPLIMLIGGGLILMLIELLLPEDREEWIGWLSLVIYGAAFVQTVVLWGGEWGVFTPQGGTPMILVDSFSIFLNGIFLLTGLLSVLISINYLDKVNLQRGEFYYLMMFSISGMMLMGMANDLILVFLALELLSIPLYVLSGFARPRLDSEESAMKYFLLGAFSSAFLVFGIALVYGAAGSTALPAVLEGLSGGGLLGAAGVALILVGFGFKVAAVPFHMWTPDVYEGAPTAVTAFMSVGAKVGGFAAMMRVFIAALPDLGNTWVPAVAVIAALTMIVGNVVALAQQNVKRMLAYSSIAHAGYILIAVAAAMDSPNAVPAGLFYMAAYLFTNLGAFAVVIAVERREQGGLMLDDYKGLARRSPLLALALAFFMLSLTGIPPTGGFTGKFFLFRAAVDANLLWLAIVGVVTSVISAYFYLRIVYLSFMFEGEGEVDAVPALNLAVGVTALATLVMGLLPGPWFEMAQQAVISGAQMIAGG